VMTSDARLLHADESARSESDLDTFLEALTGSLVSAHTPPLKGGHEDGFCRTCADIYTAAMRARLGAHVASLSEGIR
jgi:hypothetical protein